MCGKRVVTKVFRPHLKWSLAIKERAPEQASKMIHAPLPAHFRAMENPHQSPESRLYSPFVSSPSPQPDEKKQLLLRFFDRASPTGGWLDPALVADLRRCAPTQESRFLVKCILAASCTLTHGALAPSAAEYYGDAVECLNSTSLHIDDNYYRAGVDILARIQAIFLDALL